MATRTDEFVVEVSERSLGYNKPQQMGNRLWLPMFLLAVMAFPVALVISWIGAADLADGDVQSALEKRHLVAAFGFLGFLGVFSAISFAIARILGRFRKGGGDVQEATGSKVQTLKMPKTAKVFILSMMMGMMLILLAVVLHFVAAGSTSDWGPETSDRWFTVLESFRRTGVAMYLFGIALGLGTIIHVLRFQATRVRELPDRS